MDYPKSTPGIGLVDGLFVDENPTTGQPGSLIPAAWANALMAELLGVIKAAGIVPSEDDNAQLLHAIQSMALSDFKKSVRCATTGPIALSGLQTIDGVALAAGDRVLVKDQATASQNWIYVASGAAWVRAQDADESAECAPGHLIPVQAGTVNKLTVWQLTNTEVPVVGDTALTFRVVIGKQGTTLADYGIADAYTKAQTYSQAQVDDLLKNVNAMPIGSILPMPMATVPPGFLELDGSSHSIAAYPALAAYLGTTYNKGNEEAGFFRLPDTRGEFLRGWSNGRDVDAGRALGSYQSDALKAHAHDAGYYNSSNSALNNAFRRPESYSPGYTSGNIPVDMVATGGGAETRPRNLAVMWCIKAWSTAVNQGETDVAALKPLAQQATKTALGVVKLATTAMLREGVDDQAAATAKGLKELRAGFLSEALQISGGGQVVLTHGLGFAPPLDSIQFLFECAIAQGGWQPGEVLSPGTFQQDNGGSASTTGFYAYDATATTVTIGCGASSSLWALPTKTTGVVFNLTLANWRFRVRVKP